MGCFVGAKFDNEKGTIMLNGEGIYKMSFPTLLEHASKGKDFVAIGDKHNLVSIYEAALSPESIRKMAQLGFKHLCIELPTNMQDDVDGYFKGKIPFEGIFDLYKNAKFGWLNSEDSRVAGITLANMLKTAKELGISVHYVDDQEPLEIEKQQPALAKIWSEEFLKVLDAEEKQKRAEEYENKIPGFILALNSFDRAYYEQRHQRDMSTAESMKEMAKEGKVGLVYGRDHYARANDFNEHLGKDRTAVISMDESVATMQQASTTSDIDLPNYVFLTQLPIGDGKFSSVGGKIQANDKRDEACRAAVNNAKGLYLLLGCTVEDFSLRELANINLNLPPKLRSAERAP